MLINNEIVYEFKKQAHPPYISPRLRLFLDKCYDNISYSMADIRNLKQHFKICLVKTNNYTSNTPNKSYDYTDVLDLSKQYGYHNIDMSDDIKNIIYLLQTASIILTSWGTISYINKYFFNKNAIVIMLCHSGYGWELNTLRMYNSLYYCDANRTLYILNVDDIYNQKYIFDVIEQLIN